MNGVWWRAAQIGAGAAILAFARPAAADEGLALRRVILSSGGVGYFEHAARVHGDATLTLDVRLDQMDDVLKSIVVYDEQGGLGEVTEPGRAAAGEVFRDLPIDPGALSSQPALLAALRGAEVAVTSGGEERTGRVLSVTAEVTQLPDRRGTLVRHRLALAANGEVMTLILEDAARVRFLDPTLSAQLDTALRALLEQRDRGRRTLTIHERGTGDRTLHVGYVTAAPLWKSTYRLVLPADPAEKSAEIVGLSVVDNQSGEDFRDVDLTLVAGNPVTFRQALYQAYYVERPEIPVEVAGRVLPRLDTGAVTAEKAATRAFGRGGAAPERDGAPAPAFMAPAAPPAQIREAATQIIFHLPAPITLASGEQALIPIIDRSIPAERVSLYQPEVDALHPLTSVMLVNEGETGLPPGVMTTYERSAPGTATYLGDARLAALPAGERRLVSFGVDAAVKIDRRDRDEQSVTLASIAGGVLRLTRTARRMTDYTIAGAAREARTVILEHPKLPGFEAAAPPGATIEETPDRYRVRVEVPAGAVVRVPLTLTRPIAEQVSLADLSGAALSAYVSSGELPGAVREALRRIAALRAVVDEKAAAVNEIEADMARITAEQARIRDNLKVVPPSSPLAARYLGVLSDQEDRLNALSSSLADARRAAEAARRALAEAIRTMSI